MKKYSRPSLKRAQSKGTPDPIVRCYVVCGLAIVFCVGLMLTIPDYRLFQATVAISYAISLLGLNLLTGYSGQFSLGHGAFFAIGAYTAAIMADRLNAPFWISLPVGGILCFCLGYLFGFPALRLDSVYLALATFALSLSLPQLLKSPALQMFTGGVQGLSILKPDPPDGILLSADQWIFICAALIATVLFIIAAHLVYGPFGRALMAVRDHAAAAESMGVNSKQFKTLAFGISALYAGIGGGLSAFAIQFVAPDSFTAFLSISLLIGIVVGGIGTLSGALYGAVFLTVIPSLTDSVSRDAPWLVYGLVLIAAIFVFPAGLAGKFRKR